MKKTDRIISFIVLGLLVPVMLLLLFWWGGIPFAGGDNRLIPLLAFAGLLAGIILDGTFLRRFIFRLFELPLSALAALEVFYSVMVYGFCMGFPVFNAVVGIAWGYIVARSCVLKRTSKEEIDKSETFIRRISLIILFALCVCTAMLALNESTIREQVKGMLNLPFEVTTGMIWTIIVLGGTSLLLFQYFVTKFIVKRVIANTNR